VPACFGADDDAPGLCDDCWLVAYEDREQLAGEGLE